jgi:hypothetical protein
MHRNLNEIVHSGIRLQATPHRYLAASCRPSIATSYQQSTLAICYQHLSTSYPQLAQRIVHCQAISHELLATSDPLLAASYPHLATSL